MPDRQTGELTVQEARACVLHVQGATKAEAVKQAFKRSPVSGQRLSEKASRLFKQPQVAARVRELVDASKVQDLCSVGRWGEMVLEGIQKAWTDGNMTAYFNGTRQLGQAVGALQGDVNLTMEARASDKTLLEQMAGKDKAKLALAREMLGAEDTFEQASGIAIVKDNLEQASQRELSGMTWKGEQGKASKTGTNKASEGYETRTSGKPGQALEHAFVDERMGIGHKPGKASKPSQASKAGTGKQGEGIRQRIAEIAATVGTGGEMNNPENIPEVKAFKGGQVDQSCVDPETYDDGHTALRLVPEAKDTFDA